MEQLLNRQREFMPQERWWMSILPKVWWVLFESIDSQPSLRSAKNILDAVRRHMYQNEEDYSLWYSKKTDDAGNILIMVLQENCRCSRTTHGGVLAGIR
jgi:hypothetical protein